MPAPAQLICVLLDLFHAEQRLTRVANKQHCCFGLFVSLVRDAFLKVDQEEFERLVTKMAAEWNISWSEAELELMTTHWRWARRQLPKHIPPREELSEELSKIQAAALHFHDSEHKALMTDTVAKVSMTMTTLQPSRYLFSHLSRIHILRPSPRSINTF